MTAPTAKEIEQAALASLASFPTIARFVQAGDPRVLAQIRAQATMLAMLAEQVEVSLYEPFTKARDSTVLADATLKGVLPLARACRVSLLITNSDVGAYTLPAGRRLYDPKGRIYTVDSDTNIPPGETVAVTATQQTTRTITHTVGVPAPYYRVEVTPADTTDTFLTALAVWKGEDEFKYQPDWFNVDVGALAYQVETDELRRLFVCFGHDGVVGYGVQPGDEFELQITECEGKVEDLADEAVFTLEYVYTLADGKQKLVLDSVLDTGAAPPTMADLRVMARYPAIYDHNAVYLGEFDFLLRRYLTGIVFLSVWNEQIEEHFRGPDVDHINRLFIAGRVNGMDNATFEARVRELIRRADDSYRLTFVQVEDYEVSVVVNAKVSVVHDLAAVEAQIRGAILANYSAGSTLISVGMSNPLRVQPITKLLKAQVPALQDELSDFDVVISMLGTPLPEQFVQISDASLEVNIEHADHSAGLWNH